MCDRIDGQRYGQGLWVQGPRDMGGVGMAGVCPQSVAELWRVMWAICISVLGI